MKMIHRWAVRLNIAKTWYTVFGIRYSTLNNSYFVLIFGPTLVLSLRCWNASL